MEKYNLILDVALCQGCNNCFMACKDEFFENDFLPLSVAQPRHGQRWMHIKRNERGQYPLVDVAYAPQPCLHCDAAPCIEKGGGAVYKRDDGIVIIDPEKAAGKKEIVASCPYGAIFWNEDKNVAQKCTLCAHLLDDGWREPRCVQACPTGALRLVCVEDSEMKKTVAAEALEVLRPQLKTSPRVYYRNLYRYTHCFIAGNVALKDTDECAEGATIIVLDSSKKEVERTETNNYGDFRVDKIAENSGKYSVVIEYPEYGSKTAEVEVTESKSIGTVFLEK